MNKEERLRLLRQKQVDIQAMLVEWAGSTLSLHSTESIQCSIRIVKKERELATAEDWNAILHIRWNPSRDTSVSEVERALTQLQENGYLLYLHYAYSYSGNPAPDGHLKAEVKNRVNQRLKTLGIPLIIAADPATVGLSLSERRYRLYRLSNESP